MTIFGGTCGLQSLGLLVGSLLVYQLAGRGERTAVVPLRCWFWRGLFVKLL